jgi:Chemotaxis phosphatase CheX
MTPAVQTKCLDALADAVSELSATVLGMSFASLDDGSQETCGHGAYLGAVAQDEAFQVGIIVPAVGCQVLAKALLGMDPAEDDLPDPDVSDAMCEIINIVAGGLKRRINTELPVTIGLPIFVAGQPWPNAHQSVVERKLSVGEVPTSVILLTQKQSATQISRTTVTEHAAAERVAKEQSA